MLKDDLSRGAVAGDRGRTSAARPAAVGGYGEERRPWSGRCGRGRRANSCSSAACSRWVRRGTTTLVGALWPGTEGKLLQPGGPQWVGWGMNDDRPGRCGRGQRANSPGSAARSRWDGG